MNKEEIYKLKSTLIELQNALAKFDEAVTDINRKLDELPQPEIGLIIFRSYPFPNCLREISSDINHWVMSSTGQICDILNHPKFDDEGLDWLWRNWHFMECQAEQNEEGPTAKVYFEFRGANIINPFLDETGRFPVNPILYYGTAFLDSDFCK